MKHAAVLGLACLLSLPLGAQTYSDPKASVGGGGSVVRIPTDQQVAAQKAAARERARQAAIPANLTPRMIWVDPAKVSQRRKHTNGSTILILTYAKKVDDGKEEGVYFVAGHPAAEDIAVNEKAPCIIVPGPVRDDLDGERLYYFFDKDKVTPETLARFRQLHPSVPLD